MFTINLLTYFNSVYLNLLDKIGTNYCPWSTVREHTTWESKFNGSDWKLSQFTSSETYFCQTERKTHPELHEK